jgi:predicted Zn-dependent peptidase
VALAAAVAVVWILSVAGAGSAQQTPPRVTPPAPPAFPTLQERSLSNGAGVLIMPDSLLPWVDVSLMIPGGRSADTAGLAGTAELVSQLITRGTDRRSPADLASAVDRLAVTLSVVVGTDWTTVSLGSLTTHLDSALALMADVVMRPSFPQAEVQRVRRQAVVSLQTGWTEPRTAAVRTFRSEVYVSHPYGLYERPEEVREVTVDDLRAYHRRIFRPEGSVFLVSGDIDPDDVTSRLESHFTGWATGTETPASATLLGRDPLEATPAGADRGVRSLIVHAPGSTRAVIRMGHALVSGDHADWAGLSLLGQILGGGPDTRLGSLLRARGWSGSATAALNSRRGPGLLEVALDVRVEVADSAVAEVLAVLDELRSTPAGVEETETLKSFIASALPLQLATGRQVAGQVGRFRTLAGVPVDAVGSPAGRALEDYAKAVRVLTPEELLRIAGEHLRPQDMTVVVVGDARLLRPRFAALGPVRMVDMDGGDLDLADLTPPVTPLDVDASSLEPGTWRYRISLDGEVAGEMVRTLAPDAQGEAGRLSLRSSTTVGPQVLVQEVTFDSREFRPLSGSFSFAQGGQQAGARIDVGEERVVGDRTLPDGRVEPFEAPVVPGSLVGEMLEVALWLTDLREGLELVLPVLQVESGAVAYVRVRVLDRTRVTVPAGRYDAYRIEIEGAQAPQLVYARVRAPHIIVRLETPGQPFVIELEAEEVAGGG